MPIKKIRSDHVEIGMYVSSLDRPWVETPFLFQGFVINDQNDIDELCRHTQHVYVVVPDEEIQLTRREPNQPEASAQSELPRQTNYKGESNVDDEINKVRHSHALFPELFSEVESIIRTGGPLPFELFKQPAQNLVQSVTKTPDAYIWLTQLKKFDSYIYKSALTAAIWATALGNKLGIVEEELQNLAIGCMLMDIGKLSLPPEILHKPGRLTNEEWEQMKTHVDLGLERLQSNAQYPSSVLDIVRTHHERLDGSGYPNGLKGDRISLFGQIAGMVDQYVAVTNPRPYAETISPSKAEEMLYNQRGTLFDEMLVEYFIQALSTYPTGSLVELSSGEVGIVKAQKSGHNLRPDVILLLDPDKQPYGSFTLINLDNYNHNGTPVRIAKTLADGEYGIDIEELSL
ncbi:HD-GYP domain-containing protein [Thiohalophilus thiocyanatoxydans]|uniref:HD domain-containing protein n=1 Tax=Thiohalophilus thiocyanatoxydans TaxID=381308 RepID=A0A4R8ITG7_9GAMM|nr:HD-GYP domain-containing protein [Thiohalophilus thiocyanatoxydans]TDY00543.1 HD domain-containing protein [Thiohalophilus thiocyanatoxydans]